MLASEKKFMSFATVGRRCSSQKFDLCIALQRALKNDGLNCT